MGRQTTGCSDGCQGTWPAEPGQPQRPFHVSRCPNRPAPAGRQTTPEERVAARRAAVTAAREQVAAMDPRRRARLEADFRDAAEQAAIHVRLRR